ncbi:MAG: hypothetical protein KGS72_21305 [Cyanobacteria bacterium REEB67]|nr:hypothetical protein [Cyanobacteria bacterium REEB67]
MKSKTNLFSKIGFSLAASLTIACGAARAQMGPAETAAPGDALSTLNGEFRNIYAAAREKAIAETEPLIVCYSDHMVLIDGNYRDEASFLPAKYTQLKVVDHVPLALFVLLHEHCDKTLDENMLKQLGRIKELVIPARRSLAALELDSATLDRQYRLLDQSLLFIDRTIDTRYIRSADLLAFCRRLKPEIMENAARAVGLQIQAMDDKVSTWRKKLGDDRFKKITVVIVSGHMPRDQHSCYQYFARVFDVKEEGQKIVYSEGPAEEKAARELVGTHVLDASIGDAFFREPLRMHRDLLSDGAREYLHAHRPKAKI